MSRPFKPQPEDFVPFGGYDIEFATFRPNQCICGRSMSEKWGGDRCPFCGGEDDE